MIKVARKPSSDPVQEKLRQNKALWNKEVSTFVNDLIHYKKLMNGWPNKFHKERSRIVDPIPADPATIIGSLAGDFAEIVNKGNSLIQEQVNYSKNRRKKQPKQLNLPLGQPQQPAAPVSTPAAPPPDLSKQLELPLSASRQDEIIKVASIFEEKYFLESEASNPITRFFARLLTPTMGFTDAAHIRKARMAMLDSCATVWKQLEKFQVQIVKSSEVSIADSYELLKDTYYEWAKVKSGYDVAKELLPKKVQDSGGKIETPSLPKEERDKKQQSAPQQMPENFDAPDKTPEDQVDGDPKLKEGPNHGKMMTAAIANAIINDYAGVMRGGNFSQDLSEFSLLNSSIAKFKMEPDDINNSLQLISAYRDVIGKLNAKYQTNKATLRDIAADKSKKPVPPATAQLESVAQDFLKKWVGKVRHQLFSGKTSALRLNAYKSADKMRKNIDKIMDHLEKGMDVEVLSPLIQEVNSEMMKVRATIRAMHLSQRRDGGERVHPYW